uniref:Uncharacterized protein n=1 Tax=Erpetoichthys calabaricus TaxID=27687 RepID=A0A8C4T718_ERPCA
MQSEFKILRNIGNLHNLESDSRDISHGMAFTTKPSNQNFIIFLKRKTKSKIKHLFCDLLAILDKLDSHTLSDGRVRLLGFNAAVKRCFINVCVMKLSSHSSRIQC